MYLLESPRRGDSYKYQTRIFSKEYHRTVNENNTRSADFCADRIDVITNFVVLTKVVIKRAHYTMVEKLNDLCNKYC